MPCGPTPTKDWRRSSLQTNRKFYLTLAVCCAACVLAGLLSVWLGAADLTVGQVLAAVIEGPKSVAGRVVWYARIPRTAATVLSGSALAVAGCVIQAVLSNSLASPGIIGVNAGAGLAVTVLCAVGAVSGWAIAAGSFLGALGAGLLVTLAAQKVGASRSTVILGGVAVNSFLSALSEAVTSLVPDAAGLSVDFRTGGFSAVAQSRLIPAGILIVVSLILVLTLHNELDIMTLGEETAQGLGMNVKRTRTALLILAALLAGASVSFAGLLGFVGLIVPHAARKLVGSESRHLLPIAATLGAAFVTICDLAGRLIFAPYELSAGVLMSLIGGPFFVALLLRRKGGRSNA